MLKCRICGAENDTVRILVRDEYDQVRWSYKNAEDAQTHCDPEYAAIDRGADLYRTVECRTCRVKHDEENVA